MTDKLIDTGSQNVPGYRKQTPAALDVVRQIKALEVQVAEFWKNLHVSVTVDVDPRLMAVARTTFSEAFMWFNRAVFQPEDPFA
jgi:hypothetical protein